MKNINRIAALFAAVILATAMGCASDPKQQSSAGVYVDDTVITTKTKAAFINEPTLKSAQINVETFKGVVQLSGFVESQADINKAVSLARAVGGVTAVKNDMRLR
jgi:osmotically-inducible protein OsmY